MCLIYIATGIPKINLLISLVFQLQSILECTVFWAWVHIKLCICCFMNLGSGHS